MVGNGSLSTEDDSRNGTQCPTSTDSAKLTLEMVAYIVIAVAGFTGNILVSLIIYRNKKMRTSANYFILNMSISDILFLLILMPRKILEVFVGFRGWLLTGIAGEISCKFVYFFQDISMAVSIESIVILAADRFLAVMFPMKAGVLMSRARRFIIPSTWVLGAAVHAPYFYTFKLETNSKGQTYCNYSWEPALDHIETERIYSIVLFVLLTLVPVCTITILYSAIVIKLNSRKTPPGEISASRRGRRQIEGRERQNRNVSLMVVMVVVAFILLWSPLNIYTFLNLFVWKTKLPCNLVIFRFAALLVVYANSVVNPTIYFIFSENYRRGLKNLLCKGGGPDKDGSDRLTRNSKRTLRQTLSRYHDDDFSSRDLNQDANGSPRMAFHRIVISTEG